ncbi:MAG: Dam family site-specific DNA-(adenine-N6)-methyltransferase, partial [Alicyclobacillus sp.]|nr:Dam family site-specific DNA-(adenine-N6)-methyltransferase [Alicyclobacillus sp.]
ENNQAERYYALREAFNETADTRLKAALFVYLNRHGYNGLCRYNKDGGFNVPFGRYAKPYFPELEMLAFAKKAQAAEFACADYRTVMGEWVKPGDVVYCDPPYVPLSDTANFTSYSAGGFDLAAQSELATLAEQLGERGIPVVISNHENPFTRRAYAKARITSFAVQRFISCDGSNRGAAMELLAVFGGEKVPHGE